jgi:predicted phage-related endonuclease
VSIETDEGVVTFDNNTAAWLENYKNALAKLKEWQEVADVARTHIEKALGNAETGLFENRPVVRWSFVESRRFDTKRAKEILPQDVLNNLELISYSRRFALVEQNNE